MLDSSEDGGTLEYLHGHDEIITGLEKALEGREAEEKITVVVSPEDALL